MGYSNGVIYVVALFDGHTPVQCAVDTGATTITIPPDALSGVSYLPKQTVDSLTADGMIVKEQQILLASVMLDGVDGTAEVHNVEASIGTKNGLCLLGLS
jgi:predicted aspartyl protease